MQSVVHHLPRRVRALAVPGAAVVAALALSGPAAASPAPPPSPYLQPAPVGATPQGIIMSDGRICNPRWGC